MKKQSHSAMLIQQIIDGEANPFHTIEALGEHVNACWGALHRMGIPCWEEVDKGTFKRKKRPNGNPGEITYHLNAIDEYQRKIFNVIAALLPELYDASEGDTEALAYIRTWLEATRDFQQRRWDEIG